MIELIIGVLGLGAGIALAYIAPEELRPGQQYLLAAKRILFILQIAIIDYFLYHLEDYGFMVLITLVAALLLAITIKFKKIWYEIPLYVLIMSVYLLYPDQTLRLLIASLLFLYGLPLGALIRLPHEE